MQLHHHVLIHYYVTVRPPSLVRRNGSKNFKLKVLQDLGCCVYVLVFSLQRNFFYAYPKTSISVVLFALIYSLYLIYLLKMVFDAQCFWFSVLNDGVSSGLF